VINFRFHLVSLTAVFLALAAGITIGAGVVDRATVAQIERQLATVEANRKLTRAKNDELSTDLSRWGQFSQQAGDRLVEGRLEGANVLVVAMSGVDRPVVEGLTGALAAAGANYEGTLWFTGKWALSDPADQRALASLVGSPPTLRPADLRDAALSKVIPAWQTGDNGLLVVALRDAGFVDFDEPPPPASGPLAQLPLPDTSFVVVSSDTADAPSVDLALPLIDRMAAANLRVLAAQPSRRAPAKPKAALPPEFVPALRTESQVAARISTVDNADDFRGRVASVFALAELRGGRNGHYGFASGVRLMPDSTP